MNRRSIGLVLRVITLVAALFALSGLTASAHPEFDRADPPPDALLAAPIKRIDIWFAKEDVDAGAGSPLVVLISESGERIATDARVDENDPKHVIAETDALGFGVWTVAWQVRSLDDGHTLTGSYSFRIGGSSRAPGAATTEGERPQAWNVATRWATFLGAALVVGAAGLTLLGSGRILRKAPITVPNRIKPLGLLGVAIAAISTLAEPYLFTRFPPANSIAPSLDDAFDMQPNAWLMRLIALTVAVLLASLALVIERPRVTIFGAGIAGLIGIFGLSMTGHAAAREHLRPLAIGVDTLHQWSIALWIGMLLLIVLSWRQVGEATMSRFSTLALPIIIVGILAGVINSVFTLPEFSALWSSDYGRVLIAKVLILGGVLLLALFNRSTLTRVAEAGAAHLQKLRVPIRAEALLAIVVALGGTTLSLLAPATVAEVAGLERLEITHYSAPAPSEERLLITLHLSPAQPGINEVGISIKDLNGNPVPNDAIQRVFLDVESLISQTNQSGIELTAGEDGRWTVQGSQLSIADWWRITAHVRRAGLNDAIATFFIVLPDPNLGEFPDRIYGEDDPAARAVFDQGLTSLTHLHRVSYTQQIATGTEGQVVLSLSRINDGFDGSTPAQMISTEQSTAITIGDRRWLSMASSGRWGETPSNPPIPPFEWGDEYVAATGFRLGGIEEINGEPAQIVTFYTPQTNLAPAYYTWWVSTETGQILQIAMVSRVHYMTQNYFDFDGDIVIEPPVNPAGTPVATPGLDITNVGS